MLIIQLTGCKGCDLNAPKASALGGALGIGDGPKIFSRSVALVGCVTDFLVKVVVCAVVAAAGGDTLLLMPGVD